MDSINNCIRGFRKGFGLGLGGRALLSWVSGLGLRIYVSGFRVQCFGFRVQVYEQDEREGIIVNTGPV